VGAGVSDYDVDWGHGRMMGATLWIDAQPVPLPRIFNGLGVESEARDISFNRGTHTPNYRQDTAGGGPIYKWRPSRNFDLYVKGLMGLASMDFISATPNYTHDTRTFVGMGGGLEYRAFRSIWVRADYEYQIWASLMNGIPDPQGFTVGAMYNFRNPRARPRY